MMRRRSSPRRECPGSGLTGYFYESDSELEELELRLRKELVVWVKYVPFEFGILPVPPCSKLAIPILEKCMSYVKQHDGWTPNLSLANWYHLCNKKISLDWDLGWNLIRLFDLLYCQNRKEVDEPYPGYWAEYYLKGKGQNSNKEDEFYVPTLPFFLFIYLQHTARTFQEVNSSKAGEKKQGNEEPQVQGLAMKRLVQSHENRDVKISEEEIQLEIVMQNISTYVEFLEIGNKNSSSDRISGETVNALNYILCATVTPYTRLFPTIQDAFEYSKPKAIHNDESGVGSGSVNKISFFAWITKHLKVYPWGPSGSRKLNENMFIRLYQPITYPTAANENLILWNQRKSTDSWIIFFNVNNQLFYKMNFNQSTNIKIHRCKKSFFYLPSVTTHVVLDKVVDCTIYLGPVTKICKITKCERIKFIGIVRQLMICDTIESEFGLYTPCPTLLTGNGNKDLIFGPYNSIYPRLAEDLITGGFTSTTIYNNWNSIFGIGKNGYPVDTSQDWKAIHPSSYYNFIFPLPAMSISYDLIPMPTYRNQNPDNPTPIMEPKYVQAAKQKDNTLDYWKSKENEHELTAEQRKAFETIMFTRFLFWLRESGHEAELIGLKLYYENLRGNRKGTIKVKPKVLTPATTPSSLEDVLALLPFTMPNDVEEDEGDEAALAIASVGVAGESGDM